MTPKLYLVAVDDKHRTMTLAYDPPITTQLVRLQARKRRLLAKSKKALHGSRPTRFKGHI